MEPRKCRFILILGEPGCGKTTFAIKAAEASGRNKSLVIDKGLMVPNYDKYKIVDAASPSITNLQGWGRSNYSKAAKPFENLCNIMERDRWHGTLLLDDCRQFIRSNPESAEMQALESILSMRRHYDADIFAMAHGFTKVPPMFWPYVSHLVLFKTSDSIESRKNDINNYEAVAKRKHAIDTQGKINAHYKEIIVLQSD